MKKKLSFIFIIILLLLQVEVQAVNLGTLVKNTRSQVMRGETAKFTILLWNSENSSFPIRLRATQVPEGLSVIINPKEFMMNYSKVDSYSADIGMEYVNTPYGLMKTIPVDVLVKVSNSINLGEYDVYVNLAAGESTGGISTVFDKTFNFNMKVVNYIPATKMTTTTLQKTEEKLTTNIIDNMKEKITGMFSKVSINPYLIFIASLMIGIFLFCWISYKYE